MGRLPDKIFHIEKIEISKTCVRRDFLFLGGGGGVDWGLNLGPYPHWAGVLPFQSSSFIYFQVLYLVLFDQGCF
jgi:hypothetical protein